MPSNGSSEMIQYTVQPGDSYWSLAYQYNTTVEAIMAANPGVDPNNLMIGQIIMIPDPPPYRREERYEHRFPLYPFRPYPYPPPFYSYPPVYYPYPPYIYPYPYPPYPYRR